MRSGLPLEEIAMMIMGVSAPARRGHLSTGKILVARSKFSRYNAPVVYQGKRLRSGTLTHDDSVQASLLDP